MLQRMTDNVLRQHIVHKICLVCLDDMVVFSTSLQEHISNLKIIFQTLRNAEILSS